MELAKRWKNEIYFSEHFIPVLKNLPNKSNSRSDFSYADGHNKFYLKQRKEAKLLSPNVLSLTYEWKVSFPESPMLHSFKHHE